MQRAGESGKLIAQSVAVVTDIFDEVNPLFAQTNAKLS
jgi:hypothetical protein